MCDSWIKPTRKSIINFLVYCNKRMVLHNSMNGSNIIQDANYIKEDMMVKEIGHSVLCRLLPIMKRISKSLDYS